MATIETSTQMSPIVLGYSREGYGVERVAHGLPLEEHGIRYRRVRRVPLHKLPFSASYHQHRHYFAPAPRVSALHLFNDVCASRGTPWICSVEMEYPRYFGKVSQKVMDEAWDRMASDDCRLLLPLSNAARRHFLSRVPEARFARIEPKTRVFTGGVLIPQVAARARETYRREEEDLKRLRVIFVGRQFWHKGGPAVLDAVERVREMGADVELTIVSNLCPASHVVEPSQAEIHAMRERLLTTPFVHYFEDLPNHQLLELMACSDVLAFPTLDESLGWVAVEAIGLGLPVVATNVFALGEIAVAGESAFVIELPLDGDGRWRGIRLLHPGPRPSYRDAHEHLVRGCVLAFTRLLDEPHLREQMGEKGKAHYRERFEPRVAAERLSSLVRRVV